MSEKQSNSELLTALLAVNDFINDEWTRLRAEWKVYSLPGIHNRGRLIEFAQRAERGAAALDGIMSVAQYLSPTEQKVIHRKVIVTEKHADFLRSISPKGGAGKANAQAVDIRQRNDEICRAARRFLASDTPRREVASKIKAEMGAPLGLRQIRNILRERGL